MKRAVALRALGLGDLLTGLPALRGLRRVRPDHRLVVATTSPVAPLASRALPDVDVVAVGELAPLPLTTGLDLAVNLHGRGPQSHRVLGALQPMDLVGYDLDGQPRWPSDVHEVDRWCSLIDTLLPPGAPPVVRDDLDLDPAAFGLCVAGPDGRADDQPTSVVHPGAAHASRRWPAERWAAVARSEARRGRRVLVTGSAAERRRCATVVALGGLDPSADRSGTTILELANLVAGAGRVICGDTGVGHLATALGRPSVLLFGPSSPAVWGPPPTRTQHRVLWAGRLGDAIGRSVDPGLLSISVADVARELEHLDELAVGTT